MPLDIKVHNVMQERTNNNILRIDVAVNGEKFEAIIFDRHGDGRDNFEFLDFIHESLTAQEILVRELFNGFHEQASEAACVPDTKAVEGFQDDWKRLSSVVGVSFIHYSKMYEIKSTNVQFSDINPALITNPLHRLAHIMTVEKLETPNGKSIDYIDEFSVTCSHLSEEFSKLKGLEVPKQIINLAQSNI